MPSSEDPRQRSVSGEIDDSDIESPVDGSHAPGKPGRKKNPNSQAARRDQNRIAQREFRLRKQQRIRDLEARVEILSGGKDEALGEIRNILKDLMDENQTLRSLLRSLSAFIGEGAGGLLPRLGWDLNDFNSYVNRSDTDTAWEGYQRRKKAGVTGKNTATANAGATAGQKRPSSDGLDAGPSKRPREGDGLGGDHPLLVPLNTAIPPSAQGNMFTSTTRTAPDTGNVFSDLIRGNSGSPLFMQASPPMNNMYNTPSSSNLSALGPYMNSVSSTPVENGSTIGSSSFKSAPANGSAALPMRTSQNSGELTQEQLEDDEDPKKNEAMKLIHYHLDNYKRNSAYCLPTSLRPTLVQRTVPHESVIDRILHPELRDRMILLRGRFDLVDCLLDYKSSVTIHGDDVLAHGNWEIGESWLQKYGFLIDPSTLGVCNRWRRERGDHEIRQSDISPADSTPSST